MSRDERSRPQLRSEGGFGGCQPGRSHLRQEGPGLVGVTWWEGPGWGGAACEEVPGTVRVT